MITENNNIINLHTESIYLQGARDMLLRLEERGVALRFVDFKEKQHEVYNKRILEFIKNDRDNLRRYLLGDEICFCNHDVRKGKLVSVDVKFR